MMSIELSEASQIDRLSSLPPELLSTIFDFAHDFEEPLRESLSKTLLPYFRQNLYREIRISSSSSLSKLLATIETTPSLAPLVKDLRLTYDGHTEGSPFESLASEFPALKSLSLPAAQFYKLDSVTLPGLRSLSYSPLVFDTALVRLELTLYDSEIKLSDNFQPSTTIRTLEELTLVGAVSSLDDDEWDVRIGRFVESCPKLRSLKLVDRVWPRFEKFLESLAGGVLLLTKLELVTSILTEISFCSFIHLYPLFPNLTFLSLGEGTTAPNLASHLRKLSSLSILRLGPDAHYGFDSIDDLVSLVQGSRKPPALKLLILECFGAAIGYRCDIQDEILSQDVDEQSFREAWTEARYFEIIDEGQYREFLELAEANGVQVKGDIHAAISFEHLWDLEVANRHVLYAYQNRTLELLKYVGGSEQAERLPKLDFDKLDPDNLKLVKIDLPEEDWFQLSLE